MANPRDPKWTDNNISRVTEDDGSTAEVIRSRLQGWDAVNSAWLRVAVDTSGQLKTTGGGGGGGGSVTQGTTPWVVDGSAVTQPVSAAALPLPSGASTGAKQDTGNTSLSSIDARLAATILVSAASLPLPTGASTGTKQDTGNASLASIDGKLANPLPVTGPLTDTQIRASALPVSGPLTDTQIRATALPVSGSLGRTWNLTSSVDEVALSDSNGYNLDTTGGYQPRLRVQSQAAIQELLEQVVAELQLIRSVICTGLSVDAGNILI